MGIIQYKDFVKKDNVVTKNTKKSPEIDELKLLCKDLMDGVEKCTGPPFYIVQPFLSIYKKHGDTMIKYGLV